MKVLFAFFRNKRLAAIPLAVVLCLLPLVPAYASEFVSGNSVNIASGQTVEGDLYVGAGSTLIDGTVTGDVIAASGSVTINGTVGGSVMAASGSVTVNGRVGHSIRTTGGTVDVGGTVGGDVVAFAGTINLLKGATVAGQMMTGGGTAMIQGTVNQGLGGNYSDLTIAGTIHNGVNVEVNQLRILSGATIDGGVTYRSTNPAIIDSGAQISGDIVQQQPPASTTPQTAFAFAGFALFARFIAFLMALVTGIVFILLVPKLAAVIADTIMIQPLPTLGWGAAVLIGTPIVIVLLMITVLGIPLALILLALYLIALWFSQILVGLFLGKWIIERFNPVAGRGALILALLLGLVILSILSAIPCLGFLVSLIVAVFGLGALVLGVVNWWPGDRPAPVA